MLIIKEYLKAIKPKEKGTDDKYTWWMYNKLKEKCYYNHKFYNREVFVYKSIPAETENQMLYTRLYLGKANGNREIMGYSLNGKTMACFMFWMDDNPKRDKHFEEIHDFFERYLSIGICAYAEHNEWYSFNNDKRYVVIGNTRKCKYCGHWQHREFYSVKKIKKYEKWVN